MPACLTTQVRFLSAISNLDLGAIETLLREVTDRTGLLLGFRAELPVEAPARSVGQQGVKQLVEEVYLIGPCSLLLKTRCWLDIQNGGFRRFGGQDSGRAGMGCWAGLVCQPLRVVARAGSFGMILTRPLRAGGWPSPDPYDASRSLMPVSVAVLPVSARSG